MAARKGGAAAKGGDVAGVQAGMGRVEAATAAVEGGVQGLSAMQGLPQRLTKLENRLNTLAQQVQNINSADSAGTAN